MATMHKMPGMPPGLQAHSALGASSMALGSSRPISLILLPAARHLACSSCPDELSRVFCVFNRRSYASTVFRKHPSAIGWLPSVHRRAAANHAAVAEALPITPVQAGQQRHMTGPGGTVDNSSNRWHVGRPKQTLDYTTLAACCHELLASWVPSKVEEVVQPDKFTLSLRLRTPISQGWLHLSWHPTAARVCMGQPPMRGDVAEAFSFVEQTSNQLRGLVLLSACLPAAWERVVQLDFGVRPGEPPTRSLFCEVMAKYSNVVLVAENKSVIQAAYQVGGGMSSLRQVQQGRPYQLPPTVNGLPPDPQEQSDSWQSNIVKAAALVASKRSAKSAAAGNTPAADAGAERSTDSSTSASSSSSSSSSSVVSTVMSGLVRAYMGVSPALAEELCVGAGVEPSSSPDQLSSEQWQRLYQGWSTWLERLHSRTFVASSCPETGKFSALGSYSQQHDCVHDMLDDYYRSIQAVEVYAVLHQRLAGAVRQALKKGRGRLKSFDQQMAAAEDAAAVQRQADIIVANMYRIPAGADELQAEDWDTGEPITLQLDPTKTPMAHAEGLYKRARKLRRAVDAIQPLMEAVQQELDYLETVELELTQMPAGGSEQELAALREVQEELVEAKIIKPPPEAALSAKAASKGRKAHKRQQKSASGLTAFSATAAAAAGGGAGLRQYDSPGGFLVLVGRNNKQNDVLSHQIAKPGDIWMHVRGLPGSHTVIKVSPGKDPSQEDLQFAADLAAYFSKAREAGKVDVIMARAENLKKFKGAKPGQVLVTKEEGNAVGRPGRSAAAAQQVIDG